MPLYEKSFQDLSQHYEQSRHAHLHKVFGSEPGRENSVDIKHADLRQGVGVKLGVDGSEEHVAWAHLQYRSEYLSDVIELHMINPRNLYLGQSALVDTVRLVAGDVIELGRKKYPELDAMTSRHHALIEVSYDNEIKGGFQRLAATVTNLNSTNGTGVARHVADDQYRGYDQGGRQSRSGHGQEDDGQYKFKQQEYAEPHPTTAEDAAFVTFLNRHQDALKTLSEVDLNVCYVASKDLKNRFDITTERKQLEREFNRQFHPDRGSSYDKERAHTMYVLIKRELSL